MAWTHEQFDPLEVTRMAQLLTLEPPATESLQAKHVCLMAVICLVLGLGIGYAARGSQTRSSPAIPAAAAALPGPAAPAVYPHPLNLDQMKQMADKQAEPLLSKLKANPNDTALLMQVGAIYHGNHQFKDAAIYYGKAVQNEPKNSAIRTKLVSSLYRSGDVDGALTQLNQGLSFDPANANSLFNLGMIRLQGKGDGKGAIAAWQQLLKTNPNLSPERKAEVQKLMADVMTTLGERHVARGAAAK
jgi:cytochrome c-type biogenesis protein CcmH/NrfG